MYRYSRDSLFVLAQGVSDVCMAVFIVAYVSNDLRSALGGWVILMFLYSLGWESMLLFRRLLAFTPFGAEAVDAEVNPATVFSNVQALGWSAFAVAPGLAAGFFLSLNALAPGNWLFPGMPASSVAAAVFRVTPAD